MIMGAALAVVLIGTNVVPSNMHPQVAPQLVSVICVYLLQHVPIMLLLFDMQQI